MLSWTPTHQVRVGDTASAAAGRYPGPPDDVTHLTIGGLGAIARAAAELIGRRAGEGEMSLANATVTQVLIPVADLDRGVAFYRDILGIPFLFSAPPQMAFFICGSVRLLVGVPPEGEEQRSAAAVYFGIADIQAAFASLKAKGVRFQAEPHVVHRTSKSELWLAEFTDPDGNQLALMSEQTLGER